MSSMPLVSWKRLRQRLKTSYCYRGFRSSSKLARNFWRKWK
ncbi:hypothetical protein A6R68_19817 [Neotoma lepida]|uniref:Uncharacterized protein n=1 Tax=Neotoma lepida TaxID=56216 RepID=A0A1A6HGV0_NEOLE|nr:hypothetical protein A6R68_19817 [Neotoma lepida]